MVSLGLILLGLSRRQWRWWIVRQPEGLTFAPGSWRASCFACVLDFPVMCPASSPVI